MIRRSLFFVVTLILSLSTSAQIAHGGQPLDWDRPVTTSLIPTFTLEVADIEALRAEDELIDQEKSAPFRFGAVQEIDIDILAEAAVIERSDGSLVYRYAVHSPGAISLSFLLNDFYIPAGGRLYLWNAERTEFLGAFTPDNNKSGGMFAIGILPGEMVVFEYHLNAGAEEGSSLHLIEAVHGYRTILNKWEYRGPFGLSGECNVNVLCPVGIPQIDQVRSVAMIVGSGLAICSGTLIANTAGNSIPYFLTADHCLDNSNGDPTSWVYYFQHQSATCIGSNGPIDMSISGAEELFSSTSSDVALLQLTSTPPESFDPFYAGWNASTANNVTSRAYSIHHPRGDVKKICFEEDSPFFYSYNSTSTWRVEEWEIGVTEGGSSGGALFDKDHRIIGQLLGGAAACEGTGTNGEFDLYGRFGVSHPMLETWLDPIEADSITMTGYYIYGEPPPILPPDSVDFDVSIVSVPNSGQFRIELNEIVDVDVTVYDALGNKIFERPFSGDLIHRIDLRGRIARGVYLIRISSEEKTVVKRMVYGHD